MGVSFGTGCRCARDILSRISALANKGQGVGNNTINFSDNTKQVIGKNSENIGHAAREESNRNVE